MTRIDDARLLRRRLAKAAVVRRYSPHSFSAVRLTRVLEEGYARGAAKYCWSRGQPNNQIVRLFGCRSYSGKTWSAFDARNGLRTIGFRLPKDQILSAIVTKIEAGARNLRHISSPTYSRALLQLDQTNRSSPGRCGLQKFKASQPKARCLKYPQSVDRCHFGFATAFSTAFTTGLLVTSP